MAGRLAIGLLACLIFADPARAGWDLSVSPAITGLGDEVLVSAAYNRGANQWIAGPVVLLSSSALPKGMTYGGRLGFRRYFGRGSARLFVQPEYGVLMFPTGTVQTLYWNYGIDYRWPSGLYIGQSLGLGGSYELLGGGGTWNYLGQLRGHLGYQF